MDDGFLSFARTGAGQRFLADVSRIANKMEKESNRTENGEEAEKEAQNVSHR